jgi:hypothetical protein
LSVRLLPSSPFLWAKLSHSLLPKGIIRIQRESSQYHSNGSWRGGVISGSVEVDSSFFECSSSRIIVGAVFFEDFYITSGFGVVVVFSGGFMLIFLLRKIYCI